MLTCSYPFEELLDHLRALQIVSKYENVTLEDGEETELPGDRRTFADMSLRVMDYMRQLYSSEEEAFFKGSRLAGSESQYIAVLKQPPVTDALTAVRAWLVSLARK